jgi:hypothetical protein
MPSGRLRLGQQEASKLLASLSLKIHAGGMTRRGGTRDGEL